jgi:dual specificity protein kinase YAK1
MSYIGPQQSPGPSYYPQDHQMAVDPTPKRKPSGFRRVRTVHDLQPRVENASLGRRVSAEGTYLSVCVSSSVILALSCVHFFPLFL